MKIINLSSIRIADNRQRQEFDPEALMELTNSIEAHGLMHAPVVRETSEGIFLVAGERRIRAIQDLWGMGGSLRFNNEVIPEGHIPVVTLGELSILEAEEAELDENLKRRDLTWQEHAAAVQRLHNLRQAQKKQAEGEYLAEVAVKGETPEPKILETFTQTVADTALEVKGRSDGGYQDAVRKELIVAKHLDNPAVAKAKSVDEAFKILKREEELKRNEDLAAALGPVFKASSHALHHTDCLEWMSQHPGGEFDVILTDPPYGMGAQDFGDASGKLAGIEHHYDDSYEAWQKLMTEWVKLSYHVTKPQAHAYVFCDIDRFHELKAMMQAAGWYVFRTPFTIHKINSGRVPLPDRGPRRQTEWLLYAIKGNKPVTHIYPDLIAATADANMTHGAQKPVAIYQNLLQRSVKPGDKVLDSFAGSGTIFPACHSMKVFATGLEANQEYYAMGLKRLQSLDDDTLVNLGE